MSPRFHHLAQEGVSMQLPIVEMQHGGVHVRGKAVVAPAGKEHDVGQLHVQDLQPEASVRGAVSNAC